MRTNRMVAYPCFGASNCSTFPPVFLQSASHAISSAIPSHHLKRNLFAPAFFALHLLPSQKKTKGHESLISDPFLQSTLELLN